MRNHVFDPQQRFDKFLSQYRYSKVLKTLKQHHHIKTIYDFGCGTGNLVKLLYHLGFNVYGIDFKAGQRIISANLNQTLPFESDSADMITSLANLEHLHEPLINLKEAFRLLRKNGILVLTTPSPFAKPVLEFLAFRLKLINADEILDHKQYFSKSKLQNILQAAGFARFQVKYFQMGMNLHAIAIK